MKSLAIIGLLELSMLLSAAPAPAPSPAPKAMVMTADCEDLMKAGAEAIAIEYINCQLVNCPGPMCELCDIELAEDLAELAQWYRCCLGLDDCD
jgi:hypothetical protein